MKKIINKIPDIENEDTKQIFKELAVARRRGFFRKSELLKILKWKTNARPIRHFNKNDERFVKEVTQLALATKNDVLKIHILTALNGISYPTASAILMFYNRKKYPVLDIRVWKQLHKAKLVKPNPRGQNFTLLQWEMYLQIIWQIAKNSGLTARQVEKRLFDYSKKTQKGTLYKKQV